MPSSTTVLTGESVTTSANLMNEARTVDDELMIWTKRLRTAKSGELAAVESVIGVISGISRELHQCVDPSSGTDVIDGILLSLQHIWTLGEECYGQERIVYLLDLIGAQVTDTVRFVMKQLNLWIGSYTDVSRHLNWGIQLTGKVNEVSLKCTKSLWRSADPTLRQFTLPEHVPDVTGRCCERLREILRIRTVHRQMTKLVPVAECPSLYPRRAFAPFKGLNALASDSETDRNFAHALQVFERDLAPAEAKLTVTLRETLDSSLDSSKLILQFKRYREVISRQKVLDDIYSEREGLLRACNEVLEECQGMMSAGQFRDIDGTQSRSVNSIYNLRQFYFKTTLIEEVSGLMLDLPTFPHLLNQLNELRAGIQEMEETLFQEWLSDFDGNIIKRGLALNDGTPVIYFNQESRFMQVSFTNTLFTMHSDAKELTLLGFRLPQEIINIVDGASKFLKQADDLHKIAECHNTIGGRMIPSQRPMMLETAVALSKLVDTQNAVSWTKTEEIEDYISNFRSIVRTLNGQNRHLTRLHRTIETKIQNMLQLDVFIEITQRNVILDEIRQIINGVEAEGYQNVLGWKNHLDNQLYKGFETAYLKGLEGLNDKVAIIPLEIIYRQGKIQYKPDFEETESIYAKVLRRYESLPKRFSGIDPEGGLGNDSLAIIAFSNLEWFLYIITEGRQRLEEAFAIKKKYDHLVTVGGIDLSNITLPDFDKPEDWTKAFYACNRAIDENAKLPYADETFPPFRVSSKSLKTDIDALHRKYFDILSDTIMSSTNKEIAELDAKLRGWIHNLRTVPVSPDEVSNARLAMQGWGADLKSINRSLMTIKKMTRIIRYWVKLQLDLAPIKQVYSSFQNQMAIYQTKISAQIANVSQQMVAESVVLRDLVARFKTQWDMLRRNTDDGDVEMSEVINFITQRQAEWLELKSLDEKIMRISRGLDLDIRSPPGLRDLAREISSVEAVWTHIDRFNDELKTFQAESWIFFRNSTTRFEEFLQRWVDEFSSSAENPLVANVLSEIRTYQKFLGNMKPIRGDSFVEKHWAELYHILKMTPRPFTNLTLGDFLAVRLEIEPKFAELKNLNRIAASEVAVRQALDELESWETEAQYTFVDHLDSHKKVVQIVQDFKTILNKLGDNLSTLNSIKSTAHVGRFTDQITSWEGKLADLDSYLTSLNRIQVRWIYLEPVFSHGVLINEQTRFRKIDKDFRGILQTLVDDNHVVTLLRIQGIGALLANTLDQLQRCQNSLNEYLEKKRSGFPRFYFLGDDDLLEILGQATKPSVIQSHLKKLFAGIYNVDFDDKFEYITAMKSQEGEVVQLKRQVKIRQNVEEWLSELSQEMKMTLKSLTLECVSQKRNEKRDPDAFPSQILSLCNSISFTGRCEESIRNGKLSSFMTELRADLTSYTTVQIDKNHPNPKVIDLKLKDLILDVIHQISTLEFLISSKITNVTDFAWQKQLRFYVKDDGDVSIRMADAEFSYSYEYQGNIPKLVHTPLTDKCYLTLTQGMRIGLGGNPFGPAGTGKTESVKALGALLGRQVLVFNCDEGIDVKAMGRIFIGLVKCGAWGCFDEFNRLDGATLSAVSMQIQPIQSSLKQGEATVRLMDEIVPLDSNAGIFVTLNPAGKAYGGRNELPDNLKQLFRPVAMSIPDNDLIAEVILQTEGFRSAKTLGNKLVEIFKLSSALLTPQTHYDWGLRALKTVLKGCGNTLRNFKSRGLEVTDEDETDIVVSALRLNTLPKLPYADAVLFNDLIKDLFGDIAFKDLGHVELEENVRASFPELKLHLNENQVRKCLQLYEQLEQRMGVVIVGPPRSGKSTICAILKHALIRMKTIVKSSIINPKAIRKSQLLGHINADTRQWSDGVLTLKAQEVYNEPDDVRSWIICDGDIDPVWVESLNSVLDDNRLLTLPSGWRIKFGPNVNFLFETHDLSFASPATVSRMGMILTNNEDADVNGVIASWLETEPSATQAKTAQLIKDYFHKGVDWVIKSETTGNHLPPVSIVKNGLSHMSGVVSVAQMAIAMIRGIGCHLGLDQKLQFTKTVLNWTKIDVEGNLANVTYNEETERLVCFDDVDFLDVNEDLKLTSPPLVKTANVKQTLAHIDPWMRNAESFLLVGVEGCGKIMILEHAFSAMRDVEIATIHCSSLITPQHVLQKLSQICISKSSGSGREYIAKSGGRLILYFKDLNLVKPDKWGTCQLVEFLLQIITHRGFYDVNLEWIWLKSVQIVASITVGTSDGRHSLSPRFTSNVRYCVVTEPLKEQLIVIYKMQLTLCLKSLYPTSDIGNSAVEVEKIVQAMILVYEEVKKAFPRSKQSHYQFTSRDLTNWVFGMMRYDLDSAETTAIDEFIRVWSHEASRLFRDRLVSSDERASFDDIMVGVVKRIWSSKENILRQREVYFISVQAQQAASSSLITLISKGTTVKLIKVSTEILQTVVERGIAQFAKDYRDLNIVTFPEVLENVAHFDRILSARSSSMVLAGRSGIGRRTALSIVASLQGAILCTLKVGRNYGVKQFKNDLKNAIKLSAIEGNKVFLIVEDFQLIDEIFLDMLNGLLSSGEVPGLYTPDELETVMTGMRDLAEEENYTSGILSFFVKRIKELLHVIFIMDYTNNSFHKNCEHNPALYKQCSLLWLDSWSSDSLRLIPKLIISKLYKDKLSVTQFRELAQSKDATESDEFVNLFRSIFASVTTHMASPRRYIAFVHTYGILYVAKRGKIHEKIVELRAGVQKLDEAKGVVQKLRSDASAQEVVLDAKKEQASKNWKQIMEGMSKTSEQEANVKELQVRIEAENELMLVKKQSIDAELQQIQPTLLEAQLSVGNLTNDSLIEIRSLRAPPETIKDILEGVLSLMGIQDTSWTSMKSFLGRRGVKDDIRNFDVSKIKPSDRKSVEGLLKKRAASFDSENARRASRAAAPLASWVIANVNYSQVLERIEPLMSQQAKLEQNLNDAKARIHELTVEKTRVVEENERLKIELEVTNIDVASLRLNLQAVTHTLVSAEALVEKLQDEFIRWTEEASALEKELESLPIKSLLAAAFVTYLSDADEKERVSYVNSWLTLISNKDPFDFRGFMSSEQEVLSFQSLGLPSDRLSQENAVIILQTSLRPYLIDPSSRATGWLERFLQKQGHTCVRVSLRDQKFALELELAVRFGKALIVHEMDEIDPILMPILRGDFISQGSRDTIQIGDKVVDYSPDFKLFMTTRNPSPVVPPDAAAVVTIVNFTTTKAGLTTQLLSTTLSFEKPELEARKTELLKQTDEMKQDLSKLATQLLKDLSSATGNILKDEVLLNSLQQTKIKSTEINASLEQKQVIERKLNTEIDVYRPFAEFGSVLFFSILDVPKLNRLYKFSLSCFINLFSKTLGLRHDSNQPTEKRIRSLQASLENLVYEYVCQSLFKGDRLAFAIHLTHAMHPEAFQNQEWEVFAGQLSGGLTENVPSWVPEERQAALGHLSTHLRDLFRKLHLENDADWSKFMSNTDCENSIPTGLEGLTPFQIVLTIQALRPDRLFTAMSTFARTALNRKSLFPPPTSFREILEDTLAKEPILILVASGADPSEELRELGTATVGEGKYSEISMGKQEPGTVLELIKEAASAGKWLCLKNLHLVTHWLDALEKEIQQLKPHAGFRLWLTSEPHDSFPTILAESCLKIAYESPEGLKKNLQRTYTNWSKEYVTGDRNLLRMQALFALAFFHAVVQERRTYIPQGWSKFYEFNESDLRAGAEVLDNMFKASRGKKIQWNYIRGIFENAIYGGRVDNEFDLRILVSYLEKFFTDDVLSGTGPQLQPLAPGIQLPTRENYQDFISILENFPDYDSPLMFGLPVNIERSWQRTTSILVINQLKSMARQLLEEGQFQSSVWSQEMTPVLAFWKKLNQGNNTTNFLTEKLTQPGMKDKELNPLENFVFLEQSNIVDFLQSIHRTMANVSKICRGIITPSSEMLNIFKSLSKQEAPDGWLKTWEGPHEYKAFMTGLVTKVVSIQRWVVKAQADTLLNEPLNMADLMHPISFLSAFKQYSARKQNLRMDELAFVCYWKRSSPKSGIPLCRLTGLYMEGCTFDGTKLTENTPQSPHVSKVPECAVAWVPHTLVEENQKEKTISVPLYYNETRQTLITCLDLPMEGSRDKWVQTGVGLFLKSA